MKPTHHIIPSSDFSPDADWRHAHELASALESGWRPEPQPTTIATRPGEYVAHTYACGLNAFYATPVHERSGGLIAFGSPLLLVASVAGSIGYNMWQNQKAREQAAAQWRYVGSGMAHFTNQRIAVATETGWQNFDFSRIEAMEMEPDGIVVFQNGRSREKISLGLPLTHFILLRFLAYGEIPRMSASSGSPDPTVGIPTAKSPESPTTLKSTIRRTP